MIKLKRSQIFRMLATSALLCCWHLGAAQNFITKWDLSIPGTSPTQLFISTATSGSVNYTWQEISPGSATGSGSWSGSFVLINGLPAGATIRLQITPTNFRRIIINNGADRNRLVQVENWGSTAWTSMQDAFYGCANLQVTATDVPNLSGVTTMSQMFFGCTALNSPSNINTWNTGTVTDMIRTFAGATSFNQNIGSWNTAAVTNMAVMFYGASAFDQNIGSWNTGAVTNMSSMFGRASAFNNGGSGSIDNWNTSAVFDMSQMFNEASAFNQNIGSWNTAAVLSMFYMFASTSAFNQDIGAWNTAAVINMAGMFASASAFNQDIGAWNTVAANDMTFMFASASAFNQNLGGWPLKPTGVNLSNLLDNSGMDCSNYSATLIGWSANPSTPFGRFLGANGRQYGTEAVAARTNLIATKGWTIAGDTPSGAICAMPSNDFVTVWDLATLGSGATQLSFGAVTSGTVSYTWQEISPGSATGSGSWSGSTLTITGLPTGSTVRLKIAPSNFQRIIMDNGPDVNRLTQVESWGSTAWTSMLSAFTGCSNLQVTATDVPDLSGVTEMSFMFSGCAALNSPSNINTWNTSTITSMEGLFSGTAFNQDIGLWNTSSVTNMTRLFSSSAFNQDIGSWNTASVTHMTGMFGFTPFNQNIGSWNTAAVIYMGEMFLGSAFNQDISSWNTVSVQFMNNMFESTPFNQNIGAWNTSSVLYMDAMFRFATAFNNGGSGSINNWNTGAVRSMTFMFNAASSFNQNIGSWNTASVTDMWFMFAQASSFNNGGSNSINNWNTAAVTNMFGMFFFTSFNQNIGSWNTANVTSMQQMFQDSPFNNGGSGSISSWNTSSVISMQNMFAAAPAFNQDIGSWNTAAVTNMGQMFFAASAFNQSLGTWTLNPTVAMTNMLHNCGMNCSNYSATLVGWNANPGTPNGRTLTATGRQYGSLAVTARANLVGPKGWVITGDALAGGATPTISSFAPLSGGIGATVTITGTNFDLTPGNNVVKLNGITATVVTGNTTSLTITVPAGATTGTFQVIVGCHSATSAGNFTLTANPPSITSFTPQSGPVGTSVTIMGTNFSTTQTNNLVYFGATRATVTAASTTSLSVTVPAGTTHQPISVQVAGLIASSTAAFVVTTGVHALNNCSFAPRLNVAVGPAPTTVKVADLDGDGKPDVISASRIANTLVIFHNTSVLGTIDANTLAPPYTKTTGGNSYAVVVEDLDGDGKKDIATSNVSTTSVSVFRNTSTPGVISFDNRVDYAAGSETIHVNARDLDGDGKPELMTANRFGNSVSVFKNTSVVGGFNASSFAPHVQFTVGSEPYIVEIADLNADGKPDLVASNSASNTVTVLQNQTTTGVIDATSFTSAATLSTGILPIGVTLEDLDNDGKPDITIGNHNDTYFSIYRNIGSGPITAASFAGRQDFTSPNGAAITAPRDLNGDSKLDLLVTSIYTNVQTIWENVSTPGTINFTLSGTFGTDVWPGASIFVDLDGDDRPEAMVACMNGGTLSVFKNQVGAFAPPTIGGISPAAADIGAAITITGTNFDPIATNNTVLFNGVLAVPTTSTTTSISVNIPVGATTGLIAVTVNCQTANSTFTVCSLSAPITVDGNHCGPGAVGLSASGATTGQEYRWYDVASAGTSQGTLAAYTTPSITTTGTYYVSIFETATSCESPRAPVIANIRTVPPTPGVNGAASCVPASLTLGASGGVNGDYRWYTTASGGTAIPLAVDDTYITPIISSTTTYFVALADAFCESNPRAAVTGSINTVGAPAVSTTTCTATSAILDGPVGFSGYLWSTGATTPQITVTSAGSYTLVVTSSAGCTSPPSSAVSFTAAFCNQSPTALNGTAATTVTVPVTVPIVPLLSDPDNNLDLTTLIIVVGTSSGAPATINANNELVIDYSNTPFAGTDRVTLRICDQSGACVNFEVAVEVAGEITIFNAISPNGDGKNDFLFIEYIDALPDTKENKLTIFDRWGNPVFEVTNYDNTTSVFTGISSSGSELPTGTYYYSLEFSSEAPKRTGFISLKR